MRLPAERQLERRIRMPAERWTAVRSLIVEEKLARLTRKHSALVYLTLYDRAYHRPGAGVLATNADVQRWTKLNHRTVRDCMNELREQKLLTLLHTGTPRSKTKKPSWRVPMADFSLHETKWFPVPRFLIAKYCRRFHGAVLLILLLYYQQLSWTADAWPSAETLAGKLAWSASRVRRTLRIMGHEHCWRRQNTKLPWPLEISYAHPKGGGEIRHFHLRMLQYEKHKDRHRRNYTTITLAEEFDRFVQPRRKRS